MRDASTPFAEAVRAELARGDADGLEPAYRERSYRPLWFRDGRPRPEAFVLAADLKRAGEDGLDPQAYGGEALAAMLARAGPMTPAEAARAELALSRAYGRYAADLRNPPAGAELLATDPTLARPRVTPAMALRAASRAPFLDRHLARLAPANPVYRGLRAALAAYRRDHPQAGANDPYEARLRINLARARALPPEADARFVLVDAASGQLWLYDGGKVRETMPVAVGRLTDPTPLMSGVIRYAAFHPYWNVPPDLVRESFAPRVLREGPGYLASQGLEVLSDWSDQASVLDPATVDWEAVAAGRQTIRMRQRPGPGNMMGEVKLMLPNPLGVYLHDTPDKTVFTKQERTFSAGCVRVSNAMALTRALLGPEAERAVDGTPDQRVDLPEPVAVYIAYFTALPGAGGAATLARDVYGRDGPLLAALDAGRAKPVQLAAR